MKNTPDNVIAEFHLWLRAAAQGLQARRALGSLRAVPMAGLLLLLAPLHQLDQFLLVLALGSPWKVLLAKLHAGSVAGAGPAATAVPLARLLPPRDQGPPTHPRAQHQQPRRQVLGAGAGAQPLSSTMNVEHLFLALLVGAKKLRFLLVGGKLRRPLGEHFL